MIQNYIQPTAEVDPSALIGAGTRVWHHAQVMAQAQIGVDCVLGKGVFVDRGVRIGDRCKMQNYAQLFKGCSIADEVFIGPGAVLANDRVPRAASPEGILKTELDWSVEGSVIDHGASIGAMATILPGVRVGRWAMVGAGAVVVADVPDHGLVVGNPARQIGLVCCCGQRIDGPPTTCEKCARSFRSTADGKVEMGL